MASAISFNRLPANTRVPGFYFELDASKSNSGQEALPTLLIGQIMASGTATPGVPFIVQSVAQARALGGQGSMLHLMAAEYLSRDPGNDAPCWALPVADNAAGVAAVRTITFTGTATAAGTLPLYITGQLVSVGVSVGMTALNIANACIAAINGPNTPDLPCGAVSGGTSGSLTITARHKGIAAGDLDVRLAYRGVRGGEVVPPGVAMTVTDATVGSGNPAIATLLANLGDRPYSFIVMPYTDTANLDALKTFLDDQTGRWAPTRLVFGHGFAVRRAALASGGGGDLTESVTFLNARNDPAVDILPVYNSPEPAYLWAANLVGSVAPSLRNDPGIPLQTLPLTSLAPPDGDEWSFDERNTLDYNGGATFKVASDGTVLVDRLCTTYQKNGFGAADDSYLDTETRFQLAEVIRYFRNDFSTVFARKKLLSDGDRFAPSNVIVTPAIVRAHTVAKYRDLETQGRVGNSALFAKTLVVQKGGPGQLVMIMPITLADQLRQIAVLVQFSK